jgi:hypothetical protein
VSGQGLGRWCGPAGVDVVRGRVRPASSEFGGGGGRGRLRACGGAATLVRGRRHGARRSVAALAGECVSHGSGEAPCCDGQRYPFSKLETGLSFFGDRTQAKRTRTDCPA